MSRITKNIDVECDAFDCTHNNRAFEDYGFCTGNLKMKGGKCISYKMDKEHLMGTLKAEIKERIVVTVPKSLSGSNQWSEL